MAKQKQSEPQQPVYRRRIRIHRTARSLGLPADKAQHAVTNNENGVLVGMVVPGSAFGDGSSDEMTFIPDGCRYGLTRNALAEIVKFMDDPSSIS